MADFYTLITNMGLAKLANADLTGNKVLITHIAVGDGLNNAYYNPSQDQTALKHEVWRGAVNNKFIDSNNSNKIIFETQIPINIGGWYIREVGAFDSDGHLIAVAKVAESYKPTNQQGAADEYLIRIPILYSNTSSVSIQIDPAVVLATRKYVDDEFIKHNSLTPHSGILAPLAASMNFAKGQVISEIFNTVSIPENIMGLWFFDETGATATIKDRSSKGHDLTLSKNASLLDPSYKGFAPYLNFNSVDEYFEASDNDDFSFGNGVQDYPFSIVALININSLITGAMDILSKKISAAGLNQPKEYGLFIRADGTLCLNMWDASTAGEVWGASAETLNPDVGKTIVLISTYDAINKGTGIKLYKNGIPLTMTNNSSSYTAMENTVSSLKNCTFDESNNKLYVGNYKAHVISIIKEELSFEQVKSISQLLLGYTNSL